MVGHLEFQEEELGTLDLPLDFNSSKAYWQGLFFPNIILVLMLGISYLHGIEIFGFPSDYIVWMVHHSWHLPLHC